MILACSSSQRRRSSSSRSNRSFRAWWYVVKPPPCVQAVFPPAPSSTVTTRVADAGQQLAVVADEQHRLRRLAQRLLEPQLAGHVEVVVRLVEHQHLVRAAEQRLEHDPLLLAAGERAHLAPLRLLERDADRRDRAGVPQHLGLVAAGVGPVGQGLRVAHLGALVVALHHQQLGLLQRLGGRAHGGRRDRHQQVAHRRGVPHRPDELAHHPEAAGPADRALVRVDVAGHQAQQRGLAGAVGTDQRDLGAVTDPERDVRQQAPPVREVVADAVDVDVSHALECERSPGWRDRVSRRQLAAAAARARPGR